MKIGRNQPYPYGSGKKLEKCYLSSNNSIYNPTIKKTESTPELEKIRQEIEIQQIERSRIRKYFK